jgi:hypothetical protein
MLPKLNTAVAGAPAVAGKGSNAIWWILGIGVAAYLGYQYVWKPYQLKKKAEQSTHKE